MPQASRTGPQPLARWRRMALVGVAGVALRVPVAQAQADAACVVPDSVRMAPGIHYATRPPLGWIHRLLFGHRYRARWADSLAAPVVGPRTPSGWIAVPWPASEVGEFRDTSPDGATLRFLPLDVDGAMLVPASRRSDLVLGLARDLGSARLPTGPLIAADLARAAGLPTTHPMLAAALVGDSTGPCHLALGAAWTPPTEAEHGTSSTAALLDSAAAGTADVDTDRYLADRLFDLLIGQSSPSPAAWRWWRDSTGRWTPAPRTRSAPFLRFDGAVTAVGGSVLSGLPTFRHNYRGRLPMAPWEEALDRRLLAATTQADFVAAANRLQAALPDDSIAAAVARSGLPPGTEPGQADWLRTALQQRRDRLPDAATEFYRELAREAEWWGTDADDRIEAVRPEDGVLEVTTSSGFRRRYTSAETEDVRLRLGGGNDVVVVRGPARKGPRLLIDPGSGSDTVVDSAANSRTVIHDTAGVLILGPALERSGRALPPDRLVADVDPTGPPRTSGHAVGATPWFALNSDYGLLLGAGIVRTDYGREVRPFRQRTRLRTGFATAPADVAVELRTERALAGSPLRLVLDARLSGIELLRFFGYGNETMRDREYPYYRTGQRLLLVAPTAVLPLGPKAQLQGGLVYKRVVTDTTGDRLIADTQPYGAAEPFSQFGVAMRANFDTRDARTAAHRGVWLGGEVALYPTLAGGEGWFGHAQVDAATYLTPRRLPRATLAVRGSARWAWGNYPVHEATYLGGTRPSAVWLRGLAPQRFAGDGAVAVNVDLRVRLTTLRFVMPWHFGVLGLGDVGRVFVAGESSSRWHSGIGGGFFAVLPDRSFGGVVWLAKSDDGALGFGGGTRFTF